MREIRQIKTAKRNISNKYYISDNGSVYMRNKFNRVMVDGKRYTISKHMIKEAMAIKDEWYVPIKELGMKVIILSDGTILRRMKTNSIKYKYSSKIISVNTSLITTSGRQFKEYIHRLVAEVFICDINDKEIHHINQDPTDNRVENLAVLTVSQHKDIHRYLKDSINRV